MLISLFIVGLFTLTISLGDTGAGSGAGRMSFRVSERASMADELPSDSLKEHNGARVSGCIYTNTVCVCGREKCTCLSVVVGAEEAEQTLDALVGAT